MSEKLQELPANQLSLYEFYRFKKYGERWNEMVQNNELVVRASLTLEFDLVQSITISVKGTLLTKRSCRTPRSLTVRCLTSA